MDLPGVLDVDTLNFGLSAWDFDPLQFRPHPPGYPGYVVYLKALHLLAPDLGAADIAKWGSRLMGTAAVPVAYLCTRSLLAGRAMLRPLASACIAVAHPLLWYYGADGQAHASEALASLVLFTLAVRVRLDERVLHRLAVVALCGVLGSLRPTIALLNAPLLLWLFWGRPPRDWLVACGVGLLSVAAWYAPMVHATGGWELYRRGQQALVVEFFLSNFGLAGDGFDSVFFLVNANVAALGLVLAMLPLVAWCRGGETWRVPLGLLFVANAAFYFGLYTAEPGYFSAVAGLSILVPASWPGTLPAAWSGVGRGAVVTLAGAAFVLAGPAELHMAGLSADSRMWAPTMAHVADVARLQSAWHEASCGWAEDGGVLLVTDSPNDFLSRGLTVRCPGAAVAVHIDGPELNPDTDAVIVYDGPALHALPTGVPLEAGPPAEFALPEPVRWVAVPPATSVGLRDRVQAQASCAPVAGQETWPGVSLVWPARCLPTLSLGVSTLHLRAPP